VKNRNLITLTLSALAILGLALIVIGYLAPWVPHKTAALTLIGPDLSAFARAFPHVQRTLFHAPFIAASILTALTASRAESGWFRWTVAILTATLPPAVLLSPIAIGAYQALGGSTGFTLAPQDRTLVILVGLGSLLTLLGPFGRNVRPWIRTAAGIIVALLGFAPALWQYGKLLPHVEEVYGRSVGIGWGLVVCVLGFVVNRTACILMDRYVPPNPGQS